LLIDELLSTLGSRFGGKQTPRSKFSCKDTCDLVHLGTEGKVSATQSPKDRLDRVLCCGETNHELVLCFKCSGELRLNVAGAPGKHVYLVLDLVVKGLGKDFDHSFGGTVCSVIGYNAHCCDTASEHNSRPAVACKHLIEQCVTQHDRVLGVNSDQILEVLIRLLVNATVGGNASIQCEEAHIETRQMLFDNRLVFAECCHLWQVRYDVWRLHGRVGQAEFVNLLLDLLLVSRNDADVEALLSQVVTHSKAHTVRASRNDSPGIFTLRAIHPQQVLLSSTAAVD
jgi:hypothetical protein